MARFDHVTPPRSPKVVEAPYEQNVKRDGAYDGLLLPNNSKAPAEFDGADDANLSRCTPPPSPTACRSPALSQQSFVPLGDARQYSLEGIHQTEFRDTYRGLQSKDVTSSGQSDTYEIKPTETVGPGSVVCDVSVHHNLGRYRQHLAPPPSTVHGGGVPSDMREHVKAFKVNETPSKPSR
ncbi:hypothetical protein LTR93_011389 [Exophiala xenobiotica]|nr:hypothetical protein LTR93_011389 [Exophiala xenobiotica]